MHANLSLAAFLAVLGISSTALANNVFAHYMIGTTDDDHVATDVQDAIAVGFDGFAMNVGAPTLPYATECTKNLFDHAAGTGFKLFFSFDLYAHGTVSDFKDLFNEWKDNDNYLKINDKPVVSTFGGHDLKGDLQDFVSNSGGVYLIPNLDDGSGAGTYYSDPSNTLGDFNAFVDGYFSWESSWPSGTETNVSDSGDQTVHQFAQANQKAYMMGLSPLQYKKCCGGDYYRIGETNLPERMTQILDSKPDYTEVITWNDAGESHYVGNAWSEGWGDAYDDISQYASSDQWSHVGWQPLITSFIGAFKNGGSAADMAPPGNDPIGAIWYRSVLKGTCSGLPQNGELAVDSVNYAVVLPSSASGWKIQAYIDDNLLTTNDAVPGLNYAAVPGLARGTPKIKILTSDGASPSYCATGPAAVDDGNVPCIFNFKVAGLSGSC